MTSISLPSLGCNPTHKLDGLLWSESGGEKKSVMLIVIALESLQRLERNRIQLTFLCNVPTNLSGNSFRVEFEEDGAGQY